MMKKSYLGAVAAVALAAWAYGAGRTREVKHYSFLDVINPVNIVNLCRARQFEKRLAKKVDDHYTLGHLPEKEMEEWKAWDASYRQIFGTNALAEENGVEGLQADEYQTALRKIYGKNVSVHWWDINHDKGKQVLYRAINIVPASTLETTVQNWNSE